MCFVFGTVGTFLILGLSHQIKKTYIFKGKDKVKLLQLTGSVKKCYLFLSRSSNHSVMETELGPIHAMKLP